LISTLQHQYEITSAKALIEGNPLLKEEARKLETQVKQERGEIKTRQGEYSASAPQ